MAKLKVTPGYTPPPPPSIPAKLTLELSPEEFATLAIIGQLIGGCPHDSLRRHIDSINSAIHSAAHGDRYNDGIFEWNRSVRDFVSEKPGSGIDFKAGSNNHSYFKQIVKNVNNLS